MSNLKLELGGIALIALAASGTAFAQAAGDQPAGNAPAANAQPSPPTPQPPPPDNSEPITCPVPNQPAQNAPPPSMAPTPAYEETHEYNWVHDIGLAFAVGGGVDDFVGSTMRDVTGTGGSWTARGTLGTRSYIAGELSYIGSAQSISRLGLQNNTELIGNGAQAALRLNGTVNEPIQPFIFGGAAWRHYDLNNSGTNLSDVTSSVDVLEVPLGLGVASYIGQLMLDVRGEYRFAWGNQTLVPNSNGSSASLDRWGVTGNIGYAF
jgi:hypothetical protein